MTSELQKDFLFATRFAISAHNVQPFRFRFENNQIQIFVEPKSLLPAADPYEKDLRMSLGALIETWKIYFSKQNLDLEITQPPPQQANSGQQYARVDLKPTTQADDPLFAMLEKRFSYRGTFDKIPQNELRSRAEALRGLGFRVVTEEPQKKLVAQLYQKINHASLIKPGYIEELFSWLRFKSNHPRWNQDGLNVQSLALSGLEAFGASFVMDPQVFRFLDRLKLAAPLIDESSKIISAPWIAAIVSPETTSDLDKGRIFLRKWLEITSLGLVGAPLSLLTDSPEIMNQLKPVFGLQSTETFVNVLRCGFPPAGYRRPEPARIAEKDLLWNP